MTPTELSTVRDTISLIQTGAATNKLGRGVPTSAVPMNNPQEIVLTYSDGKKFVVKVEATQLGKSSGVV